MQITRQKIKAALYLHNWTSFPDKFEYSESDVLHLAWRAAYRIAQAQSATHRRELTASDSDVWYGTKRSQDSNAWLGTICDPYHHQAT